MNVPNLYLRRQGFLNFRIPARPTLPDRLKIPAWPAYRPLPAQELR